MVKFRRQLRRGLSLVLVAAMLSTGNLSTVASAAAEKKQQVNANEAELKKAIRDGKEMVEQYPSGLFNFLGTQMEVSEKDKALEIAVIRQGGTQGSAKVKFKAIDITSSYGDDYKIYTKKSPFSSVKKGEDAFPLIETAIESKVDLSREDADIDDIEDSEVSGKEIVDNATSEYSEEQADTDQSADNPLDQYPDAEEASVVEKGTEVSSQAASGTSLRAMKEAATGKKSDRPNWKIADNTEKADEVRENFELFMDNVDGTTVTLNFKDGEYVKYLYLVPKDDDIAECEEQLVCALLPVEGSAPVGNSYNAYINIKDNETVEKSEYTFEKKEVTASDKKAVVTLKRTAGENYFDTVYVGTGEGTANQGADYTAGLKKVEFYAGETEKQVSIDILENEYRSKSRDFYVLLSRDGSQYLKETCHVTIPADESSKKTNLKAKASQTKGTPEKISPNGWKPNNGQWAVPSQDCYYSGGNTWRQNSETRYEYNGWGERYIYTNKNIKFYGVNSLELGYSNWGNGRSWTTGAWFWKKKHHENHYGFDIFYGSHWKWGQYANTGWSVCNANYTSNWEWGQQVVGKSWSGGGNHTNAYVGWYRLHLKKYSASCKAPANDFYTTAYKVAYDKNGKGSLEKGSTKKITPSLKLDSVTSNVQNSKTGINNASYNSVYRSDALNFKLENYNSQYLELTGIQASADNKTWKTVSEGANLSVVLNADFFGNKGLNFFDTSTIYFRPVFKQKTAKLKLKVKNSNRGVFKGFSDGDTFDFNIGDSVAGFEGSGNVAAYNPAFSLGTTNAFSTYAKGNVSFQSAKKGSNLTLDSANTAGNVANVSIQSAYNILQLDYNDTNLTVMADPNTYRNTYTNLKYTIDGKTYDCSKSSDVESMQAAMEKLYQANKDAQVTISFDYLANPKYKGTEGDDEIPFGDPSSAVLNVYDDKGALVKGAPYTLSPVKKNGTFSFSKTGSWKQLGWVDGTVATITFYGTPVADEIYMTSQETEIDFLGGSGGYVSVSDDKGTMKDSNGYTLGNLNRDLTFKNVNPFTAYTMNAYVSPLFIGRWGDYSMDTDSNGNIDEKNVETASKRLKDLGFSGDLASDVSIFYGNVFKYSPSVYSNSKVYYDFVKRDTSTNSQNSVLIRLMQRTSTVINPNKKSETPLTDAKVTFAGVDTVTGNSQGYYKSVGNYEKGKTYMASVDMGAVHFVGSVQGTGYKKETIDISEYMFPTDFVAKIDGKETGVRTNGKSLLEVQNADTTFTFNFRSSVGVKPNKAIVTITRKGEQVYKQVLTRDNTSEMFSMTLNTLKAGVKGGDRMSIQGIFTDKVSGDKTVDYTYPAVDTGMTFQNKLTALSVATSFKTPFTKTLKLIGSVNTKFDLPLDYDIASMGNTTSYTDETTGAEISTIQIAFGYNSDIMKDLKQQQLEHRAENKGEALSGRDNIREYMENLMGDDGNDDDDDGDGDDDKSTPTPTKNLTDSKKAAEKAQASAAPASSNMGSNSFQFDFSVAVVLTVESGIGEDGYPDGDYYFDSLMLIASANADFQYSVTYTTPIGVDIIAELEVGGKAVAAFGAESSNGSRYDDVFNMTKAGDEKGALSLNKKNFSLYTKFMIAPTITVGAGVGLGKVVSVTVSGTADFDFGFTQPIMGTNESSSGYGDVTLSAALKLKILFIKKKWTLYKGEKMSLFNYGASSVGEMLNDFEENYLYEDIDDDSNTEKFARDYLKNQSKWQPYDMSAKAVSAGKEVILKEGAYPYPQTDITDLGNGKLLAVFLTDSGDRDPINRSELVYSISSDKGATWSEPVSIKDDGTWDEAPCIYKVADDKVLITWSDASREYTDSDKTEDVLSLLDISGAWFDVTNMTMGEEFSITTTTAEDTMQDSDPMISYDEETGKLLVFYTKVDYNEEKRSDKEYTGKEDIISDENADNSEEVTTYGDIVNGYNVIAYREANWNDSTKTFDWYDSHDVLYGQRFLDLAAPVTLTESTKEVEVGTAEVEDENGETVTRKITESKTVTTVSTQDVSTDPRVVDSDSISYNGLSLFAYTTDRDANLESTEDQQLYLQIYNYETDEFHHPIQITADANGSSKPQFVRCKGMTYLYWLNGGDIQYLNVSAVISSLDGEEGSSLELKEITTKSGTVNLYILNKYDNNPIVTAIAHQVEVDEEGNKTENKISDFDVQANDTCVYVLWTAMNTSQKDENKSGAENVVRETQVYAAYCEPQKEIVYAPYSFEENDEVSYTFVDGKDNTTYPVSVTAKKDITLPNGTDLQTGETYNFNYSTDKDLNGLTDAVEAGDAAKTKTIRNCDGYDWSQPIQITNETGANYSNLSFLVNEDGWIQAYFTKGTQTLDSNNVFEENEATQKLCTQIFVVDSTLKADEISTEKELYVPGEDITFSLDVTNDGLKPIIDAQYRMYVKNGDTVLGATPEWSLLGSSEEEESEEKPTSSVLLGGNTVTLTSSNVLDVDSVKGTKLVVELKQGDKVTTIEKELQEKAELSIEVNNTEITEENKANVNLQITNSGNKDYKGDLNLKDGDKTLATEKDFQIAYGESKSLDMTVDISGCSFGDVQTLEDGSKKDAINLKAEYGDIWQSVEIARIVSAWEGIAVDAVKEVGIGQYEISNADNTTDQSAMDILSAGQTAQPVKDVLSVPANKVLKLETLYTVDENSEAAKKLQENQLNPAGILNTQWKSSNEEVAYINSNGVLVPLKEGEVEITAKSYPGGEIQQADAFASNGTVAEDDTSGFGSLDNTDGTGWFRQSRELYQVPEKLVTTKKITVKITKEEAKATPEPTVAPTEAPTVAPSTQPTVDPAGTTTVEPTAKPALKKVKATVTLNKKGTQVTVKTLKNAKVSLKAYKTKKTATKNKKAGLIKKYPAKKANKKGKVVIKLKKKLKKKQAVRVTVTKTGYKQNTVIKVKTK